MFKKLCSAVLLATAACAGQAFPDRSVTVIVPFSAGTTTDVNARDFAQALSAQIKQPVTVENRVGAEGTVGGQALLVAAPDGHTLLFTSSSLTVLDPLMKMTMPYDPVHDFAPVCAVARTSNVMNITGSAPWKNVADVVAAAKAQPGKLTFAYASATTRLAGELFAQSAGIKLTGVPYRSSVTALTEVGGGQVDMMMIDHISATPFYQGGKLRPVAVAGVQRIKELPDVPSASEAGVPGYNLLPWFGVYASAKTPPAVLAQVREAVGQALASPASLASMDKRGLIPYPLCGEAFGKAQQDEIGVMQQVLDKAGIVRQ
ncbi:Bug family tripartite tricarboxylate transporter substrate binding protein [Pseudorhodoferax sp.]|uniref:Bug family tripartite tricarboxylate transporter substrate binding protein n=1 Tax=Pseudorhodoferax sp. TaxID=1993553 RepID=UPI0039E6D8CF